MESRAALGLARAVVVACAAAFGAVMGPGCHRSPREGAAAQSSATSGRPQPENEEDLAVDLLQKISWCDVFHRGELLDFGSAGTDGRYGFGMSQPSEVTHVTREGASWARVSGRTVSQSFYTDHPSPVFVAGRIRGLTARSASVRIDARPFGTLPLGGGESDIVSTRVSTEPLEPGNHVLTLQFHGGARGQPFVDIDWLRVGEPDEDPSTFAPPVLRDLVVNETIGGHPRRAIALRAPGNVRCGLFVREGMALRVGLGFAGQGSGEAEIRILEPNQNPVVVHSSLVSSKESSPDIRIPLDSFAGKLAYAEFAAKRSAAGGRVLFGDPVITAHRASAPPRPKTSIVILVVLASADRTHLPPYAEVPALAALTNVAGSSVVFRHHRTTTTVASGSMASLVTGLPPELHTVMDSGARLPERCATMAAVAREGRIATAMFTASPTSFEAFGFGRGWDKFEMFSPVSGVGSRSALVDSTKWIESRLQENGDARMLVLVHSRGGHPPWTATAEEMRNLPPADYLGPIETRRGAQVLNRARGKHPRMRLTTGDRERIEGFYQLALVLEDQSLGALIATLRRLGAWDSTLLVVTSDVAMGGPSRIPFAEGEKLDDDYLELPLIVHFPGGRYAGKAIDSPTTSLDLMSTVLTALDLRLPDQVKSQDLYEVAAQPERFVPRIQFAALGKEYVTRFGDFVLRGENPKQPSLCQSSPALSCTNAPSPALALVANALWRETYAHYHGTEFEKATAAREPATLDPDTLAGLIVWGNQENRP